jgi:hypothetical protein
MTFTGSNIPMCSSTSRDKNVKNFRIFRATQSFLQRTQDLTNKNLDDLGFSFSCYNIKIGWILLMFLAKLLVEKV